MRLLRRLLVVLLQAVGYALLDVIVLLHAGWRSLRAACAMAAGWLAAAAPPLRPLLAAAVALPPRAPLGSRPAPPTVLGVAVAEHIAEADWPAAIEALAALLTWAHAHGFELVLVHLQQQPPLGREQLGPLERQLQRQLSLHLLQQQQCPPGAVRVVTGWQQQGCSSIGAEAAAASAAVAAAGEGAMGCSPPPAEGHVLTAVLLSAADAQWPLLAASTAAVAGGLPASADLDRGGGDGVIDSAAADLDAAIAAPARLRERLRAVAGPLAARDPDFVLVTGPALTLAGFPAWCVRVSEVYGGGGPLARLTAARLDAVLRRFSRTQQRFGK